MPMTWNYVDEEAFRGQVETLVNVSWPMTPAQVTEVATSSLGWTVVAERAFLCNLEVDLGLGSISVVDHEVSWIRIALTDYSEDKSDERDAFQHEAFSLYAGILKEMYGPGTPTPRSPVNTTRCTGTYPRGSASS